MKGPSKFASLAGAYGARLATPSYQPPYQAISWADGERERERKKSECFNNSSGSLNVCLLSPYPMISAGAGLHV